MSKPTGTGPIATTVQVGNTPRPPSAGAIDSRYFGPVLADARLEKVRLALEERNEGGAAVALRAAIATIGKDEPERSRWLYLLGVVEERKGAPRLAMAAFLESAASAGALQLEAYRHVLTLALAEGNCVVAKQSIEAINRLQLSESELISLRGEIALCEGNVDTAKGNFSALILSSHNDLDRARFQLRLAEVLSYELEPCEHRNPRKVDEIAALLKEASRLAVDRNSELYRIAALWSKLACTEASSPRVALREESLKVAEKLLEKRRWADAKGLLLDWELEGGVETIALEVVCRYRFARGQIAAATGARVEALGHYEWVVQSCSNEELSARTLYVSGGLLSSQKKYAEAIGKYSELERRFAHHRLADDAHLKRALAYRAMGSEKIYMELLDGMRDLYPTGDMTQEGLFQLALGALQDRQWGAALLVLERAQALAQSNPTISEHDRARLKYFLARARQGIGDVAGAASIYQELIEFEPFGYYMLLAYATLRLVDASLAEGAVERGLQAATQERRDPALEPRQFDPAIQRVLVLLAAGDLKRAASVLEELNGSVDTVKPLAVMVDLYLQAGAYQTALTLAKSKPQALRARWPIAHWGALWKLSYPVPYRGIVRAEASRNKITESLIYAIMREESEFDPLVVSHADAYGLMQLIVPTASHAARGTAMAATPKTLLVPAVNIALGSRVLASLLTRFQGRDALAIAGYNAGPGRPSRWMREHPAMSLDVWVESIDITETRNYVKRVLSSQAAYQWLYGSEGNRPELVPLSLAMDPT